MGGRFAKSRTPTSSDTYVSTGAGSEEGNAAMDHTQGIAGPLVAAVEATWAAIQDQHQDVPEVVVTVGSGTIGIPRGVKLGHFAPERWVRGQDSVHELFVGGEGLARGGREVLGTLLHEAGHGLALVRGIQDTSRQGRYHNERYRRLGDELGLVLAKDPSIGWSLTQVPNATAELYRQQIGLIDAALVAYRRGEVQGGPGGRTSNNNGVAAACDCGRKLRLSRAVYDAGPITCGLCGTDFSAD